MKIGPKEEMNTSVDVKNRTNATSPNQKVDLNMTAPLNSEQLKAGRKIVNEFVGANINPTKVRGESSEQRPCSGRTMSEALAVHLLIAIAGCSGNMECKYVNICIHT